MDGSKDKGRQARWDERLAASDGWEALSRRIEDLPQQVVGRGAADLAQDALRGRVGTRPYTWPQMLEAAGERSADLSAMLAEEFARAVRASGAEPTDAEVAGYMEWAADRHGWRPGPTSPHVVAVASGAVRAVNEAGESRLFTCDLWDL